MKLKNLMLEFPRENEAIQNLIDFFDDARLKKRTLSISFERLFDIAHPSSAANLTKILQKLIAIDLVRQVYRVEYEPGIGSENYSTIAEIPNIVYDRNGLEVVPDLMNTKAYYIFPGSYVNF